MHQIPPEDSSQLEGLFTANTANEPMLRAFLSGRVPGHAFVDRWPSPGGCVVAINYRFVFFGGEPTRAFQEQAIRHLRAQQSLDVVWPDGNVKLPHGPAPDEVAKRVEFRRRQNRGKAHLDTLIASVPEAEVRRIDSRMMGRCLWRDDVLRATGSTSEFLGHGLGFCLMVDDVIVAEAYAVIWNGERAEIATVSHPARRGKGYATVVCASLIKACEGVGLSAYWNCDADNTASMRLAARLGFDDPHGYRLVRYAHKPPAFAAARERKRRGTFGGFARRLFGRPEKAR